jgi:hypothetical protein
MMEIELIEKFEKNELLMPDTIFMFQLLVDRGWVWKMAANYQAQAVAYLNLGIIKPPRKERPDVKPTIKIITRDGKIDRILSEGVIDVFIQDETGGTTAKYTTVDLGKYADDDEGDAAPDRCDSGDSSPPVGNA